MKRIEGNLIEFGVTGRFDVIVHGCNCFHTMGAGVARTIAAEFPEALTADRQAAKVDRSRLGAVSVARVTRGTHRLQIVNGYTRFNWRGRGRKVDYDALHSAFRKVKDRFSSLSIGYPLIGAGLAGGDWTVIEPPIDTALVVLPG